MVSIPVENGTFINVYFITNTIWLDVHYKGHLC